MAFLKSLVFCLVFLAFCGCQKQKKEPAIHQIRFGNIVGIFPGNKENQDYKFHHFLIIDLNTDSVLLKKNHYDPLGYEQENLPSQYYFGKIPPGLKKDLAYFEENVLQKKSGAKFKFNDHEPTALYSGPVTFLEYRKDTAIRYFFQKHIKSDAFYDHQLGNISEKLFALVVNPKVLTPSNIEYKLHEDSLIGTIANEYELSEVASPPPPPPPPVQKTIKFTPPVIK